MLTVVSTGFVPSDGSVKSAEGYTVKGYFNGEPVYDFLEVFGEQIKLANEQMQSQLEELGKIGRISLADFGFEMKKISAEDLNTLSVYGADYKKSCFDFTNENAFDNMTKAADYSGMTAAEIYREIYEKYLYCFGEKFLLAFAVDYFNENSNDIYAEIYRSFCEEISSRCGEDSAVESHMEALYGDMSDEEIRRDIMGKYRRTDGITFRDFYQMTYEMKLAGVDGGVHDYIDRLFENDYTEVNDINGAKKCGFLFREQAMDLKVSLSQLQFMQNRHEFRMIYDEAENPEFSAVLKEIAELCPEKLNPTVSDEIAELLWRSFK